MSAGEAESRGATREGEDGALEEAEIHDVLRNSRRRRVIERLRGGSGEESVADLAELIATAESEESPPPRNVRQSVYVSLHQTHLPKLDELGIVAYDSDEKRVAVADGANEVAVYMEVVPKYGISWAEYYLGVGLFGLLSVVGHAVGVPVLSAQNPALVAGGVFAVVVASAAYQLLDQRSSLVHRLRE
jgi:hypothetical protein